MSNTISQYLTLLFFPARQATEDILGWCHHSGSAVDICFHLLDSCYRVSHQLAHVSHILLLCQACGHTHQVSTTGRRSSSQFVLSLAYYLIHHFNCVVSTVLGCVIFYVYVLRLSRAY